MVLNDEDSDREVALIAERKKAVAEAAEQSESPDS